MLAPKPNVLGALLPSAGPPGKGVQCGTWTTCSLGRNSAIVIIPPLVSLDMNLDYTLSLTLLPISLWFLLYIFSCRRSFLLVLWSFSWVVSLQIVVILVCPWEEVSSESSYFIILATWDLFYKGTNPIHEGSTLMT